MADEGDDYHACAGARIGRSKRRGEACGEPIGAGVHRELSGRTSEARFPEAPSQRRVVDEARQRIGERGGRSRRHEDAGRAVVDQLRNARHARRQACELLALRFEQNVGQAVAVSVVADPARQHEEVRAAVGVEHRGLRLRSAPLDAIGDAERSRRGLELAQQRSAADVRQLPVAIARNPCESGEKIVESLLVDGAAHGKQRDRRFGVAAVARGTCTRGRAETAACRSRDN